MKLSGFIISLEKERAKTQLVTDGQMTSVSSPSMLSEFAIA